MKRSNLLLLLAFVIMTVSLVVYDMSLKDAYLSGEYKKPFRDFEALDFKNFNSITLNASTAANIIVRQGPFSVVIEPTARRFVKVSQKGSMLYIDVKFPGSFEDSRAAYPLIITCPSLLSFNADSRYVANDVLVTDTVASLNFSWRPSFIKGFTLDSLLITEKHAGAVILQGNKIKSLSATLGLGEGSGSNMIILNDNHFENATLNILNKSQLKLGAADIINFKYQLADSARIIYEGAARKLIKN